MSSSRGFSNWPESISTRPCSRKVSTSSPNSPASSRWT
ncbi:putative cytochrome P450 [Mycobacterium xenopi 4042]|uniref:Putative cytochrome P450 n=1 Tax=Mycobacterium xenopi 4042 TaxID=1299334 RepID=X7ZX06_MYCXE|nr:putative cytochrome P450 [Mycobacterium xenopi 4042]